MAVVGWVAKPGRSIYFIIQNLKSKIQNGMTPKPSTQNQQGTGAIKKRVVKKIRKKPQKKGSWRSSILAIAVLSSSATLIAVFAWISIQFIFNPEQVSWLNKFLPEWAKISLSNRDRPQTLLQIQENLQKHEQIAGQTIPLEDEDETKSFLLPVFKQRANCQSDCKYIVELRIYELSQDLELQSQPEKYYQLTTQLPITGPEESFAIAPLVDGTSDNQGSNIALPLTEVRRFEKDAPSPGFWFYLHGKRQQGTNAIAYGQIVHYNPERSNLQQMLSWTSPSGQLPKWQQVTAGGAKELIVNQTVGLEPQLRIYQVKPVKFVLNPIQLEQISLTPSALKDTAYQDAVLVARSGLWTPAFEWLEFIKKQRKSMPAAAQAQIDLIRLHSQLTKAQADKSWASPSQQVLADLVDGRWSKALQVFEASPQNAQEIATLLKADGGRLSNRTETALRVNPNRPEVQAWGALIVAARQGQGRANTWLQAQPKITKETLAKIQSLLGQLEGKDAKSKITPSVTHPSRIVGSVSAIAQVNPAQWLQLNPASLQKTDSQAWYQVEVTAFHDGKRWLNFPFNNLNPPKTSPAKFFWEVLGINSDPEIQIAVWQPNGEQQTIAATIKAVQIQGGVLRLLAAATEKIPNVETLHATSLQQPKPLALTSSALEWVQPSPITIEQLQQQEPQQVKTILPRLWRSLQESGQLPVGAIPSFPQMQQKLGHWPVQLIDLTGNDKPEMVLTISLDAIASLKNQPAPKNKQQKNQSRPRTLILSDSGKVIYTDFKNSREQVLTAIAKLSDGQSLALLVENADNYTLKNWSEKNQRFQ
jgi:hypothetical protein